MSPVFYSPFQLPAKQQHFSGRFRFTSSPTAKEPSIDPFTCRSWSIFLAKILASLSRNITDSMHTNRNSVANTISNTHFTRELLVSRRGKESMHALAHISRVHFCSRFSQSSDPTVSPLRHASLSPCASCVTDKKLDFHVIVDRLHGHARDILERQARENWVYRWIFTFLSPNGSFAY